MVALLLVSQLLLLVTAFVFVFAKLHANNELVLFCQCFTMILLCLTALLPCLEAIVVCGLSILL